LLTYIEDISVEVGVWGFGYPCVSGFCELPSIYIQKIQHIVFKVDPMSMSVCQRAGAMKELCYKCFKKY
jgi:hypothetical protein